MRKLTSEMATATRLPFGAERLSRQSFVPSLTTPSEFVGYLDRETANSARIVESARIRIE